MLWAAPVHVLTVGTAGAGSSGGGAALGWSCVCLGAIHRAEGFAVFL